MRFLARAPVAALFVFALLPAARAQAPVQTSTQATARPLDNDSYSVRESAAAGDAQAQFALGNYYFSGVGVPQDYAQALLWFTRSANQDFIPAQNQLGYMYQHKFGGVIIVEAAIASQHSSRSPEGGAQYISESGFRRLAICTKPTSCG
jgi:TPR repeat protein